MFYKESQIGRSVRNSENVLLFKRKLFESIQRLAEKADASTLVNRDIRQEVAFLAKDGITVGQAQKVINVYMKYYSILREKLNLIKELDCPVDSGMIRLVWSNLTDKDKLALQRMLNPKRLSIPLSVLFSEMARLNNMDFRLYTFIQDVTERIGNGIRILPDLEVYDKRRIEKFLSCENEEE